MAAAGNAARTITAPVTAAILRCGRVKLQFLRQAGGAQCTRAGKLFATSGRVANARGEHDRDGGSRTASPAAGLVDPAAALPPPDGAGRRAADPLSGSWEGAAGPAAA